MLHMNNVMNVLFTVKNVMVVKRQENVYDVKVVMVLIQSMELVLNVMLKKVYILMELQDVCLSKITVYFYTVSMKKMVDNINTIIVQKIVKSVMVTCVLNV